MAKKTNHYYILVMTNEGPKFVTSVNNRERTSYWDATEKPLELSKDYAKDICLGLNLNLYPAFLVCQPFEIDTQPYRYDLGHFEWKYVEKENEDEQ